MKHDVDVCILGAGIAGSWLAYCLLEAGFKVRLLHDPKAPNASTMAAGLMQRISGKFLTYNSFYNHLFDDAVKAYNDLEQRFNISLIRSTSVYKSLTPQLTSIWKKKRKRDRYNSLLSDITCLPAHLSHPSSTDWINISGGYVVHPEPFFTTLHTYLREQGCLQESSIDVTAIQSYETYSCYGTITAKYLICCLGSNSSRVPAFKHIPFHFSNGETLYFKSTNQRKKDVVQDTHWVVPYGHYQGNHYFKCGATYDHDDHCIPTQKGYDALSTSIRSLGHDDMTPLMYQRARRCNLPNHLPLLGLVTPSLGLFTGFASKGFIAAAALAKQWAEVFPQMPVALRNVDVAECCC
ncbi:FAD-binding oxidoreductase [bacterium]|nr:FAD-binding oxidoreductase [bacterium]